MYSPDFLFTAFSVQPDAAEGALPFVGLSGATVSLVLFLKYYL
nr:MAG TPA: hypothetical protein [Bacteriophage sp.]DAV23950.1 MAG TPA: hypothetical protein [Bacteriophage sp.]